MKQKNKANTPVSPALFNYKLMSGSWIKKLLFAIGMLSTIGTFGQNSDTTTVRFFNGAATLTTKGLSTFPNLTLGKPAAILDLSVGGEKFRFEPTLRFALEGKPWSFIFWFRYEAMKTQKFQLKLGAHPAYSFKTITITENEKTSEILRVQQFLAGDIAPVFFLTKNISAGPYYLYAKGVSKEAVQNSNFISLRVNFSNITLTENLYIRWMAQGYYLKMDDKDGFYVNSTLSLNRRNFPFSVSSTVNKVIQSTIPGDDFLWNVNLSYVFSNKYRKN